jgi:hypothetical protein
MCNTTINDNVFYVNIILQFLSIKTYTLNKLLIIIFFQLAHNYIPEEFMVKDLQVDSFRHLVFFYSQVGVDVLYRRAIRTSGILPVKSFSQPRVL